MKTLFSRTVLTLLLLMTTGAAVASVDVYISPIVNLFWLLPLLFESSQPRATEQEPPPLVIDQTQRPTSQWFYCRSSNAYYPYVKTCAEAWEKVPAEPSDR